MFRHFGRDLNPKPTALGQRLGQELGSSGVVGLLGGSWVKWALEYHTLILFSKRNHYEIKVYTSFPLVT